VPWGEEFPEFQRFEFSLNCVTVKMKKHDLSKRRKSFLETASHPRRLVFYAGMHLERLRTTTKSLGIFLSYSRFELCTSKHFLQIELDAVSYLNSQKKRIVLGYSLQLGDSLRSVLIYRNREFKSTHHRKTSPCRNITNRPIFEQNLRNINNFLYSDPLAQSHKSILHKAANVTQPLGHLILTAVSSSQSSIFNTTLQIYPFFFFYISF
jgi:hypothetical protein